MSLRTGRRPVALLFSPVFGALMVAAAQPTGRWAVAASAAALVALLAGLFIRPAAVVAVLLTIGGIALSDPVPVLAVVSGVSAAAYLVSRYADAAVMLTIPTVLGMLGFAAVGLAATAISVRLTWAPLLAPAIMAAILIAVALPLFTESGPAADGEPPGGYE